MNQNLWCRFMGLHKLEIIKEESLKDRHDNIIGVVIISRCSNCGKIKSETIFTEEGYGR